MEKIRNLSLRKAIVLYLSISLVISFLAGALIRRAAERVQEQVWLGYIDEQEYIRASNQKTETAYDISIPRIANDSMTKRDQILSETCDFLQTYIILIVSVIGVIAAVAVFYRDKIKVPLDALSEASGMIADNKLDFHVTYSNQDELGRLCAEFERMRGELEQNNRRMWRMVEEEKALRCAIAHDIRTPLAVLKGYQEMLLEFLPGETISKEKTVEMLQEGMEQIERIHDFVETMRELSSLENREIRCAETNLPEIERQIERSVRSLEKDTGKKITIHKSGCEGVVLVDLPVVLEVTENLVSNAVRYAKCRIDIAVTLEYGKLEVEVTDDGGGFTGDVEQVTQAYYHANPRDDLKHFGLGMYISRVYCEKHGGGLLVGNGERGGAKVRAFFKTGWQA